MMYISPTFLFIFKQFMNSSKSGPVRPLADLTSCDITGAGFISEADRFSSDAATEEAKRRKAEILRKNRILEFKRQQELQRKEDGERELAMKREKEALRMIALQRSALAQTNASGCGYGIIDLQYSRGPAGSAQMHVDEITKFRAASRTQNLVRNNTRVGYNIISGEEL